MKKLLFGIIATVLFGFTGNAKNVNLKEEPAIRACVTLDCCGFGPFGVQVYSVRYCLLLRGTNVVLNFETNLGVKEVVIANEQIIAGFKNEKGENYIIPAGKYSVIDNSISFTPGTNRAKPDWCITVDRDYFGNTSSSTYCYNWIWNKPNPNGLGLITITPTLSEDQKTKLFENGVLEIINTQDFVVKDANINFTLKAGKYTVNSDGNIYIQNAKIK